MVQVYLKMSQIMSDNKLIQKIKHYLICEIEDVCFYSIPVTCKTRRERSIGCHFFR